ncbi:butyrophilin subfamily 3 member A3-like isoform X2 [Malaclemys terrapin pileata]|uniref:butyrophilin subfamily 3 member A3-like isoform X2 n=1 Tax=Malaclemys terrapin pileata TaxID=2991368 RepID=UPI0023A8A595|nr:butyrophilin subfamily 3 member A3-like isoform X2 [Malaclemys terrapin pileata]
MPLKWMLILNFILVLTSITIVMFFIRCRRQYFGHTWMRNIHWTNMKEKYICPVHPVKRGLCLIISFLILGICFLSARAATGEISDHTDWMQILILIQVCPTFIISAINLFISYKHPVPKPTNAKSNVNDWMQILILILVGPTFVISTINLFISYKHEYCDWMQILILIQVCPTFIISAIKLLISYKRNHRKQHDPEAGPLLEEHDQLQNERDHLKSENSQLKSENKKLQHENEWRKARNKTDNITLDAGTAHPNLSIAGDKKNFKHEAQPRQVPPNPQRFDSTVCVLGSEGFSSGEHYWEVDVGISTDWDLGVARKSIQRKGKLSLSPKEGFWALGLSGRDYWAKTDPWTRVMVQKKPKKIGVYLNYQEKQMTFFNVTDMSVLFTFKDCSFSGEVYPFFKNSHKETIMRISSIKEED